MKIKDLKINFRYLGGNIACLSVDSIDGEAVHNDINNEEAIIIFNSLVGEKENCQTVKTLLKENQELKSQSKGTTHRFDEEEHEKLKLEKEQLNNLVNSCQEEIRQSKKKLENCYCNRTDCSGRIKDSKVYDSLVQKVETQQKEFIKWLEDEINKLVKEYGNYVYDDYSEEKGKYDTYIEILQKYKEIIGVSNDY